MPIWEDINQVRLREVVIETDDSDFIDKSSFDTIQHKRRILFRIAYIIGKYINLSKQVRSVIGVTSLIPTDNTVVFMTAITQPLPVSVNSQILNLKNNSIGILTITGHIDGVSGSTLLVSSKSSITVHGDGTTWWVI